MFFLDDLISFKSYNFYRPFYERDGYYWLEKDGKMILFLNVLGVAKSDIEVSVKNGTLNKQVLSISGKTQNEVLDREFRVNASFLIGKPMKSVDYDVINGLLQIEIEFEEPVKPNVLIKAK